MKKWTTTKANCMLLTLLLFCYFMQNCDISKETFLRMMMKTVHPYLVVNERGAADYLAEALLTETTGTYRVFANKTVYEMQLSDALTWQMLMVEKQKEIAKCQNLEEGALSENGLASKLDGAGCGKENDLEDGKKETKTQDVKQPSEASDEENLPEETGADESLSDEKKESDETNLFVPEIVSKFASEAEKYRYYESLKDYDTLIKEFYQIDSTTSIGKEELNGQLFLSKDLSMKQTPDSPQILIYHTHSQEEYADSRPGEEEDTVMGMGELLAQQLRAYGYNVVHHMGRYDVQSRDYAYAKAADGLEKVLQEYPTVELVIDLHRDGVASETRLVTEIDGKSCAKFMFFNGLCRTNKTGMLEKLPNPNLEDNLALSFQLQLLAKEYYPSLVRRIYLKGMRYNMHYRPKSLLIELGAQTSRVAEARNSIPYIAKLLDLVLRGDDA